MRRETTNNVHKSSHFQQVFLKPPNPCPFMNNRVQVYAFNTCHKTKSPWSTTLLGSQELYFMTDFVERHSATTQSKAINVNIEVHLMKGFWAIIVPSYNHLLRTVYSLSYWGHAGILVSSQPTQECAQSHSLQDSAFVDSAYVQYLQFYWKEKENRTSHRPWRM